MANLDASFTPAQRLDAVADVYWGKHESLPKDHPARSAARVLEKVIIDYALVGGEPLADIIESAKAKVREGKR